MDDETRRHGFRPLPQPPLSPDERADLRELLEERRLEAEAMMAATIRRQERIKKVSQGIVTLGAIALAWSAIQTWVIDVWHLVQTAWHGWRGL